MIIDVSIHLGGMNRDRYSQILSACGNIQSIGELFTCLSAEINYYLYSIYIPKRPKS
jgi:hypothetical protein